MSRIDELIVRINELQTLAYKSCQSEIKFIIRPEWSKIMEEIRSLGYVAKKRFYREYQDGRLYRLCKWYAVSSSSTTRNNECEYIFTDIRPKNRSCLKGDCTTRALTYAIGGDYTAIENRQYAIAAQYGGLRNQTSNWGKVAEENNFVRIYWKFGSIKRSILGGMVRRNGKVHRPLITVSSGHCAVVDKDGSVRDTWDSRGGKVKYLYCHKSDIITILELLKKVDPQVASPSI
jgi:hypothetical protein